MRVLHLISSGGMYGAEAVILQLSAEMEASQQGNNLLSVFSHAGHPVPDLHVAAMRAGVASELLTCRGQLDFAVPRVIRRMTERLEVDIVHAHGYKADIYAYLAFRGNRRPALVSTCHTWYDNDLAVGIYGAIDRRVLRHFDEVVAVSAEVQTRLLRAGVSAEKVRLIRNGVSLPPPAVDEGPKTGAGVVEDLRVGLVGRLAPEKGVDIFLEAVSRLAPNYPKVEFVVAGDGPERAELAALLDKLNLHDHATLLGQQTDMPAFYRSLDVMVSASRQEGLPMALLEGMAHSLPIVATAVGEVPQVVVNGGTGFLVEPGSPEALARSIETLLHNEGLRERFGQAGRQRVLEVFSAQRMTADYVAVYRRALAHRSISKQGTPNLDGAR